MENSWVLSAVGPWVSGGRLSASDRSPPHLHPLSWCLRWWKPSMSTSMKLQQMRGERPSCCPLQPKGNWKPEALGRAQRHRSRSPSKGKCSYLVLPACWTRKWAAPGLWPQVLLWSSGPWRCLGSWPRPNPDHPSAIPGAPRAGRGIGQDRDQPGSSPIWVPSWLFPALQSLTIRESNFWELACCG